MTSASEPIIFSKSVVDHLPVYYRALVGRLADTGRAKISDGDSEKLAEVG